MNSRRCIDIGTPLLRLANGVIRRYANDARPSRRCGGLPRFARRKNAIAQDWPQRPTDEQEGRGGSASDRDSRELVDTYFREIDAEHCELVVHARGHVAVERALVLEQR